jgi:formate dehydrogenase maturation protein FdhE
MGLFGKKKDPPVVDLRDQAPVKLEFGLPTPCPSCGQPGYLDSIDLTQHVMYQHCPTCFTKWQTAEQDVAAH